MIKLKFPLELTLYPKQLDGIGIYSIAKLENNEVSAVVYHYETETWELLSENWIAAIMDINALSVAEEILHLNGIEWIIGKEF